MEGRAEILQAGDGGLEPFTKGLHHARLAEACRGRQQDQLALAAPGLFPAALQQGDLLLAADQRREAPAQPAGEASAGADLPATRHSRTARDSL